MTELRVRRRGATSLTPVNEANPLPVEMVAGAGNETKDYETVTVSTTAIGLTPQVNRNVTRAFITVETARIRFHTSAEDVPTSSVGHEGFAGDIIKLESAHEVANFRAIRRDSTDATLRVSYGDGG